jgi:hypothetical protein
MGKGMQRLENPALPRIGFKEKRQARSVRAISLSHDHTDPSIRFCFRRHAHARKRTRQYAIVIIASIERPSSHEAVAQISPRRTRQPGRANQLGRWP